MTTRLRALAVAMIGSMSAGCPYRCTGTIALVRGVIAAARPSGLRVSESGSTSTSTGVAPVYVITATEATKVNGTVMTSSPGPMPAATSARCSAAVPELTPTPWAAPEYAANSRSNAATSSPRTN
jgi:hypothetical protein